MKRHVIAAFVAVGLLAIAQGSARANGEAGFGIGIKLNFKGWSSGQGHGPCCNTTPPGWSPYYQPPTVWHGAGMGYMNPYSFYPTYGSYPMFGPTQAIPTYPVGPTVAPPIAPPVAPPGPAIPPPVMKPLPPTK